MIEYSDMKSVIPCPGYPFCLQYNNKERSNKIVVKQNKNNLILQCRDIVYCKSDKQYTCFYLVDKQSKLSSKNIGLYEQQLPDCFFRIHHNTILNLHFIKEIRKYKNNISITLIDGQEMSTSFRKKKEFLCKIAIIKKE